MEFDTFLRLIAALNESDVEYILVGGVAMGAHGLIRATEDIDLFLRPTEDNVARLRDALRAVWADPDIDGITAADLSGDYPTVRYGPPGVSFVIDLMARLGTAFTYEDLEFETLSMEGVSVRVATPRTLYRMKSGTARPIDQADAAALREKFGLDED